MTMSGRLFSTVGGVLALAVSASGADVLVEKKVCIGARDNKFGTFYLDRSVKADAIYLQYLSGSINCRSWKKKCAADKVGTAGGKAESHWGCECNTNMSTFITDGSNKILLPVDGKGGASFPWSNKAWYNLKGHNSHSKRLTFDMDDGKVFTWGSYRIWYGEDLMNISESDNTRSLVCFAVYLREKTPPPTPLPTPAPTPRPTPALTCQTGTRCGPKFNHQYCNGYKSWIYCNENNGWCGSTEAHKNAQASTKYDYASIPSTCEAHHPAGFNYQGVGHCRQGYYAGWNGADAIDLGTCAKKCLSEAKCKFFAFVPGFACSRYDSGAGKCDNRNERPDHYSYARVADPLPAPTCKTGTRCGPLFEHQFCDGYKGWIYCNENNGWCGSTDAHKNAQPSTKYDYSSIPTCGRHAPGFDYLGTGFCNRGYYAGWDAADAIDLETCSKKCLSEAKCKFFALKPGRTCSRYDARAEKCGSRVNGHNDHYSYARTAPPTDLPTSKPTDLPSRKPTALPSREPTALPTRKPTAAPTRKPTSLPTRKPTNAPSREPTAVPSLAPTHAPTMKPTPKPIKDYEVDTSDWTIAAENVCYGAKDSSFGEFEVDVDVNVVGVYLVHRSGSVNCREAKRTCDYDVFGTTGGKAESNWGCECNLGLSAFITDSKDNVLAPVADDAGVDMRHPWWYYMTDFHSHSPYVPFEKERRFSRGTYRLWYGEDLRRQTDWDNSDSEVCVDVYFKPKEELNTFKDFMQVCNESGCDTDKDTCAAFCGGKWKEGEGCKKPESPRKIKCRSLNAAQCRRAGCSGIKHFNGVFMKCTGNARLSVSAF